MQQDQDVIKQGKLIREQSDKQPSRPKETPREGRWRAERERAERDARKQPHKGY